MHSVNAKRCLTVLAATTLLTFSASAAQAQWFGFYWNWPSWGYSTSYYAGYRPYTYSSYYAPTVTSYYAPLGASYTSYYGATYDPCCSCAPVCCDPCSGCCSSCGAGGCYGGACASGNCPGGNCTVNDSSSWSASSGGRTPTPADSSGPARTYGDEDRLNPRDEGRDDPVLPGRGFEPRDRSRDNLDTSPADDLYRPRTRSVEPPDPGLDSTIPGGADSPMAPFSRPPRGSSGDAFGGDSGDRESFRLPSRGDDTEPSTIPQKQPAPAITPPETTPSDNETDTTPTLKLDNKSTWRTVAERSRVKIHSNWPAPSLARRSVKAPATNWEPVPSDTKIAGK